MDEARFRAAFQAGGFKSLQQVAARAGMPHTTVSRLLSRRRYGPPQKANKATLDRLASALRVTADWLTGERKDLLFVPEFEPGGSGPSLWERPTKSYVLYGWFMRSALAALRRDLREWCGDEAADAYREWGRDILSAFSLLASSLVWREAILAESPRAGGGAVMGDADDRSVVWLTHLLKPWMVDGAYLDADMVGRLHRELTARSIWASEKRDRQIRRALRKYAEHADRAVQRYLEESLGPPEDEGLSAERPRRKKTQGRARRSERRPRRADERRGTRGT